MKTEKVRLSQVKVNQANPRTIRESKLNLLVERLLVFPKMIQLRPIIVDDKLVILGGNMRVNALNKIATMPFDQIATIIGKTKDYQCLSQVEKENLLSSWQSWLEKPTVEIARASALSEAEKKEFVIADNASFGEWDYDRLANEWDNEDLVTWGLDIWRPDAPVPSSVLNKPLGNIDQFFDEAKPTQADANQQGGIDQSALPQELQGADLTPDDLPKITGTDETLCDRVIIVYPKERVDEVAKKLGLKEIKKVIYRIDEILNGVG